MKADYRNTYLLSATYPNRIAAEAACEWLKMNHTPIRAWVRRK